MKRTLGAVFVFCIPVVVESVSINSIQTEATGDGYEIRLKGSGRLDCSSVLLDKPPRIVLDCPGSSNRIASKLLFPKENPFVSQIRSAEHIENGKKLSRIVVELKTPLVFAAASLREGLLLRLKRVQQIQKPTVNPPEKGLIAPPKTRQHEIVPFGIVIGAEDLLEISVFELPQFSTETRVSGDGTVTMPLIGSIEIRGLTKKQAEQKISEALEAKYVNDANVSVQIKEYKSKQVSVLGAVNNPGPYYILSDRTLLQVLSEAGGLSAIAGKKCFVFRPGSKKIEIDLDQLLNNGDESLNIPILPGDMINIPMEQKAIVYVLGEVKTPGAVEMTTSLPVTLVAAIARAGGLTANADKSDIKIRRKDDTGAEVVLKANLKDILSGKASDVLLNAGDVINVPTSFF